ncbi:hypothetical protein Ancab_029795 [Ancistrocladus abbreviatus]
MSVGSRRSGACLCCLVVLSITLALCVFGSALFWKLNKGMRLGHGSASCPPCHCDCPPPLSLLKIAPGLINLSIEDCGKNDPDLYNEMQKQSVDLLSEELKLQVAVAEEHLRHMNATHREARRVASKYQREAEKCNVATETCEEAREHAEALLTKEKRATLLWEQRAHQMGW